MSKLVPVWLCAMVALVALTGAPGFRPAAVFAASGTVNMETPLHDSPDPAAPVIARLAEGTVVSIDGPPVNGFYPVMAGDLSGWMRGETLQVEKDIAESDEAEEIAGDSPLDQADETVPAEAPTELDPTTDLTPAPSVDPAPDLEVDPSAALEASPPVADSALEDDAVPPGEPVPADGMPASSESAPADDPPVDDLAASPPAPDLASAGDAIPVLTTPDGAAAAPDSAAHAAEVAAASTMAPNVTPIPVAEDSPVGPATVLIDAPILLGPGTDYGVITTAPAGSMVEKTGHVIDGYATVQYAEVTGWVALETLGVPSTLVLETPPIQNQPGEIAALVETPVADVPPTDPPPTELAPTEVLPAETPTAETPAVAAPIEAAPIAAT